MVNEFVVVEGRSFVVAVLLYMCRLALLSNIGRGAKISIRMILLGGSFTGHIEDNGLKAMARC
jgi:hypothetical protein